MKGTWYFADDNSDTRKEHKFYFRLKDDVRGKLDLRWGN